MYRLRVRISIAAVRSIASATKDPMHPPNCAGIQGGRGRVGRSGSCMIRVRATATVCCPVHIVCETIHAVRVRKWEY